MTRALWLSRVFVLTIAAISLISGQTWPGMVGRAQNKKVSLGAVNSPANWRVENVKISSERKTPGADSQLVIDTEQTPDKGSRLPVREEQTLVPEGSWLGLSTAPKTPSFGYEVTSFLSQRSLALSPDAVRISTDRGELIARVIQSEQPTTFGPTKTIHLILYGTVDGKDYAYVYEFAYDNGTKRLLRGSATTLGGDGYEVDYESGEGFQVRGSAQISHDVAFPLGSKERQYETLTSTQLSATLAASTPSDLDCIYNNLKSCATYFDVIACVATLGTGCINNFLRSIGLDVFCGITLFCQPLPSFNLSLTASSLSLKQGQSVSYPVQATFTGGFNSTVSGFTTSALPSGVSASFSPGSITSNGGKVTMNLSASPTAQTGSRGITIYATGSGKQKYVTTTLAVDVGRGTIQINATVNGSPWNGSIVWALSGIGTAGGTSVPRILSDMPAGAYGLTLLFGGPANAAFVGISPNSPSLNAGTTATFTFNFVTSPIAPSNLGSTANSSSQVTLSWNDNSNNETEFRIERKRTASGTWSQIAQVGSNVRNYSDSGLSSNTTYFYRVRAANQAGPSGYSTESNVTTRR
jgi:hypothetical protein